MVGVTLIGGSGFIGRYVSHRLAKEGEEVTVFDVNPPEEKAGVDFVQGDIFDREALASVLKGRDTVIDLVGLADIGECQKDPEASFRLNVASLARVLEAVRRTGVQRVVYPSSSAVYGKVETVPIDESTIPNPANIYGWHKLMAEQNLRAHLQNYGVGNVILRLFNVIGPGNTGVIHHYVHEALAKGRIRGFGRHQLRDFVHADDVSQAFYLAATRRSVVNKIINIGTGEGVSIAELADLVRQAIPGTQVEFREKPGYIPYHSVADITLARSLLNFEPMPAGEVVRRFIQELVRSDR